MGLAWHWCNERSWSTNIKYVSFFHRIFHEQKRADMSIPLPIPTLPFAPSLTLFLTYIFHKVLSLLHIPVPLYRKGQNQLKIRMRHSQDSEDQIRCNFINTPHQVKILKISSSLIIRTYTTRWRDRPSTLRKMQCGVSVSISLWAKTQRS